MDRTHYLCSLLEAAYERLGGDGAGSAASRRRVVVETMRLLPTPALPANCPDGTPLYRWIDTGAGRRHQSTEELKAELLDLWGEMRDGMMQERREQRNTSHAD